MTDEFIDDDAADDQQQQDGENPNLRQLRKKAKDHDTVAAERDQARRELAFFKAGIPDSKVGELFMKAYDGEPDTAAIRSAAAEYGLIDADVSPDELSAMDRVEQAAAGGAPPRPAPDFNAAIRAAAGHRP